MRNKSPIVGTFTNPCESKMVIIWGDSKFVESLALHLEASTGNHMGWGKKKDTPYGSHYYSFLLPLWWKILSNILRYTYTIIRNIYIYIHIYIYTHVYIYNCTYTNAYTCVLQHITVSLLLYAYMSAYININVYIYIYIVHLQTIYS